MKKTIAIFIPKPCHENWEEMSPEARGRFCAACSTTVVDFSAMTDAQIVEYLGNQKGKTCGRFKNKQLERTLAPLKTYGIPKYKQWFLAAAMLLLGLPRVFSGSRSSKSNVHISTPVDGKTMAGKVTDARSGVALQGVKINLLGTNDFVMTDAKGNFSLPLQHIDQSQKIKLILQKEGYAPVEFVSALSALESQTEITMDHHIASEKIGDTTSSDTAIENVIPLPVIEINAESHTVGMMIIEHKQVHEGSFMANVVDEQKKPIEGVQVSLIRNDTLVASGFTDSAGSWDTTRLVPGMYNVILKHWAFETQKLENILVQNGINKEYKIILEKREVVMGLMAIKHSNAIDLNSNQQTIKNTINNPVIRDRLLHSCRP